MTWVFAGILAYIAAQLMIGFWVSRFIQTEQDYLLAGRQLGPWLGTFTIFATWFGAESCIGSAGAIYTGGLSGGSADPFGFGLCLILMGMVFAVPLWKRNMTTLADLFRERYSGSVEKIAVLFMLPTTVMWAAAQIRAFRQVLSASSELDVTIATLIMAISSWLIMTYVYEIEFAYIISLGVSFTTYLMMSLIDRRPEDVTLQPLNASL